MKKQIKIHATTITNNVGKRVKKTQTNNKYTKEKSKRNKTRNAADPMKEKRSSYFARDHLIHTRS